MRIFNANLEHNGTQRQEVANQSNAFQDLSGMVKSVIHIKKAVLSKLIGMDSVAQALLTVVPMEQCGKEITAKQLNHHVLKGHT